MTRYARRIQRIVLALVFTTVPAPAWAQFSMDIPGVPRARVPFLANGDGRFELGITGYRLRGEAADTIAGSFRMGFGHSWTIASSFELGYDLSLGEVRLVRPGTPDGGGAEPDTELGGTALYGVRLGLKFTPYNVVDPDGYGISAALGVSYQPELKPVFTYDKVGESVVTRGYAGGRPEPGELEPVLSSMQSMMGAVSYRSRRAELDVSVTHQIVTEPNGFDFSGPLEGTFVSAGARLYLTSSFAVGGAYWGAGPPPWRDRINVAVRAVDPSDFGFFVTLGAGLEDGTDIMISSPTGDFSESISFYLRSH